MRANARKENALHWNEGPPISDLSLFRRPKQREVSGEWLSQHGFSVRTDLATNLPLVRFDPERVSQAVMNVVENARKYSGASKTIDIRLWSEGSSVILEVQDYGIGIPAGEQQRIFDQFYRASNASEQSGSGLGLFLVSDIMRAHRGSIELESEVGQGSRIRLVFPDSGAILEEATHSAGYRALTEKA
jgi:signal transduction histidine kinase